MRFEALGSLTGCVASVLFGALKPSSAELGICMGRFA